MTLSTNGNCVNGRLADSRITNFRLLFLYAAPYFAYVGIGALDDYFSLEWIYSLRLILVPAILIWAWRWYRPLSGPKNSIVSIGVGILAGVWGTVLWIWLLAPFVEKDAAAWGSQAVYLRMAASTLVVPVFEELFMRGYVFFFVMQWDLARKKGIRGAFDVTLHEENIADIQYVSWNLPAVVISTMAFTLGHQVVEWPASIAYGLMMAILLVVRKDLLSCVIAHGITNFCLALYVYFSGNWQYW